LAVKIANLTGFTGKVVWDSNRPDGTPRKVLDSTKINKLGWKPSITLDQGIASTVEWYQENK
jgi:GDP-L-fucose synthase